MSRPPRLEQTRSVAPRARGLVSGRVSGSRIDAERRPPPAELADVVECFWIGRWDLRGQPSHETLLLSDPSVHFVVERSEQVPRGQESRVVGVWTRLWRRRLQGQGFVRGVKLHPGAVRAFVDVPAHTLSNTMTPLAALLPERAALLERKVLSPADDQAACDAYARWLVSLRRPEDPRVAQAVALVRAAIRQPELHTVEDLAAHAEMGVRALQKLFRDFVGSTPKWILRQNRLQEAAARLEAGEATSLSDLAASLGYSDQAHFTRDFRAATGMAPGRFATQVHAT